MKKTLARQRRLRPSGSTQASTPEDIARDLQKPPAAIAAKKIAQSAEAEPKTQAKKSGDAAALFSSILKKAHITEKTAHLTAQNKYVFDIAPSVNKTQVASAVFAIYNIKPLAINIIRTKGKKVRFGKLSGKRADGKKALVTIPAGKKLTIYENV